MSCRPTQPCRARLSRGERLSRPVGVRLAVTALTVAVAVTLGFTGPSASATTRAPATTTAPPPTALVSADPLPTPQVDGIVYSVAIVGTTAYAAGEFATARSAGTPLGDPSTVRRSNLLAFDVTTGALLPFRHTITGTPFVSTTNPGPFCRSTGTADTWVCDAIFRVKASPDGSRIYIAGDFTGVDGAVRGRIAAFDTATGSLLTTFTPTLSSRVRGLAVGTDAVYVAGSFTTADGVARARVAGLTTTGRLLPFAPVIDNSAWSAALTPDGSRLIVGGAFDTAGGRPQHGIAAFRTVDGALLPWARSPLPVNDGSVVTDLAISGGAVYAGGYAYDPVRAGNLEGRMAVDITSGTVLWADQCRGDTQSVALAGNVLYSASHSHQCTAVGGWPQLTPVTYQRLVAETTAVTGISPAGHPEPSVLPIYNNTDGGPASSPFKNGPWAVTSDGTYLVVGGEFLTVDGIAQQGLTRFVLRGRAPQLSGPVGPWATPATVMSTRGGQVRVSFQTDWDRDDPTLTYQVLRDDVVVATLTSGSTFWERPTLTWTDPALTPGTTVSYRIRALDSNGNTLSSDPTAPLTVPLNDPVPADYAAAVVADGAQHYWRLGEPAGATTTADQVGSTRLTVGANDTLGVPGAITGSPDGSLWLAGTTRSPVTSTVKEAAPAELTLEGWFWTTSRLGGELVGMGSAPGGLSTTTDRLLYLTTEGRVAFGANAAAPAGISSRLTYNDGGWHHVAATLGGAGASLYVDGQRVAQDPTITPAAFTGYWRIGGDRLDPWPGVYTSTPAGRGFPWPTSDDLAGGVDDVAVYPVALTAAQVRAHYLLGTPDAGTGPSLSGSTVQVSPSDDATVSKGFPATVYGTGRTLTLNGGSSAQDVLLRFPVPPACSPTHAVLTLTVGTAASYGSVSAGSVHAAASSQWSEKFLTWASAPAALPIGISLGPVAVGSTRSLDVSSLLATATSQGAIALRATGAGPDNAVFRSHESSAALGPSLRLTCG